MNNPTNAATRLNALAFAHLSGGDVAELSALDFDDALNTQLEGVNHAGEFTHHLFNLARNFSENYEPCEWTICEVPHADAFFCYPKGEEDKLYQLNDDDAPDGVKYVDAKVFGIIMTLMALDEGTDRPREQQAACNMFYQKMTELQNMLVNTSEMIGPHVTVEEIQEYDDMVELISRYTD